MKKSIILISKILCLVLVVGLTSCGEKEQERKEKEVSAPEQIIPVEEAATMYQTYTKRRVPLIQRYEDSINLGRYNQEIEQNQKVVGASTKMKPKKYDVARYVSYDYQTLRQYMDYIEKQTKAANQEISTIRFYLSEYSDTPFFPKTKDSIKHPRQNTIVITPAIKRNLKDEKSRDYIYYIDDSDASNPEVVFLNDAFGPLRSNETGDIGILENKVYASFAPNFTKTNSAVVSPYYAGQSLTMNRGSGAPPYSRE